MPPYIKTLMLVALVMVLTLHLSPPVAAVNLTAATGAKISYPPSQQLNVKESIADTKIHPIKSNENLQEFYEYTDKHISTNNDDHGHLKLNLLHREKISTTRFSDHRHRLESRMKRDVKRVSSIVHQLTVAAGGGASADSGGVSYEVEDFGSDVVSGMELGSGEYVVRIGVGSPARSQYMVIDSGSDVVWVQCQPCAQCYQQSDPVFDPAESASFSGVACGSSVCDRLESAGCHDGRCRYEVSYGDGSYTKGILALETLTIGGATVRNVAIGCGHRNRGLFIGAAGLLGLGGGSMSLVGQLGGQTGGAFSYCLVSRGTGSTGSLVFGRETLPVGAAWVPLIRNPRAPSFYYIGLSGLGVGGMQIPVPGSIFHLSEMGTGGVVMDTGTAVTRLPTAAYEAFRDAFVAETASLPRSHPVSIFDTCYNLNGFVTVRVPTVSFYFSGGQILTLPARNFLIPVDQLGTFCFAFAPSSSGLSIIGNIQQEGIQISYDGANGFVGFGPNVC